jgi:hypothetical protein
MAGGSTHHEVALFTSKLNLNLRKKLAKYYTWSEGLSGAENCRSEKPGEF